MQQLLICQQHVKQHCGAESQDVLQVLKMVENCFVGAQQQQLKL